MNESQRPAWWAKPGRVSVTERSGPTSISPNRANHLKSRLAKTILALNDMGEVEQSQYESLMGQTEAFCQFLDDALALKIDIFSKDNLAAAECIDQFCSCFIPPGEALH